MSSATASGTPTPPERTTERARRAWELALREALSLGHNYIGTEHLLLALVRQDDTLARSVLDALGATPDAVRNEVIRQLSKPKTKPQPAPELSLSELLRKAADHLDKQAANGEDAQATEGER